MLRLLFVENKRKKKNASFENIFLFIKICDILFIFKILFKDI